MRIAILSDIHGNREAFEAAVAAVAGLGVDCTVLLGDLVGYGPDPDYVVERAVEMERQGVACILGNHDEAAAMGPPRDMSEHARAAIEWTRKRLTSAHLDFLRALPATHRIADMLFVHASADRPLRWLYIDNRDAAADCLSATDARTVVCGHTHVPALFYQRPGRTPVHFQPLANIATPLSAAMRHVIVTGSVGQPRDGNPCACLGLIDTAERTVTMVRVPYDHAETARKIEAGGLPAWLGQRLRIGR